MIMMAAALCMYCISPTLESAPACPSRRDSGRVDIKKDIPTACIISHRVHERSQVQLLWPLFKGTVVLRATSSVPLPTLSRSPRQDAGHARCTSAILRGDLWPPRELPRNRSTPSVVGSISLTRHAYLVTPFATGQESPNPRYIPQHVYGLRDRLSNEHPRLQAQAQHRT